MKKAFLRRSAFALIIILIFVQAAGCVGSTYTNADPTAAPTEEPEVLVPSNEGTTMEELSEIYDFTFSKRDTREKYDDADAVVQLSDGATTVTGEGVDISGDVVYFNAEGIYFVHGELTNGKLVVNAPKEDKIQIILNQVDIACEDGSAIEIWQADKVFITLAAGTENRLSDGETYVHSEIESDACIYSKEDLTINGSGELTVKANYRHGIVSKDDLVVANCILSVTAVKDGLRGKDCVKSKGASISIEAGSDAIMSDNASDIGRGYIYIDTGTLKINAGTDGLQAENVIYIADGELEIVSGGGSKDDDMGMDAISAKAAKAGKALNIGGGSLKLNSAEDGLHSDGDILILGGEITIEAGNDGIHASDAVEIKGGSIRIEDCYEGVDALNVTVTDGSMAIVSEDDCIKTAYDSDENHVDSTAFILLKGGYLHLTPGGDGINSAGSFVMSEGVLLVNGSIKYDEDGSVIGGVIVTIGSKSINRSYDDGGGQEFISFNFGDDEDISKGTVVTVKDDEGAHILSFTTSKSFETIVISCPELVDDEEYSFYLDCSVTDADQNGFAFGAETEATGGKLCGRVGA